MPGVTGRPVVARAGAVVVVVEGRRARVVPVLARYAPALLASAAFAGRPGAGRGRRAGVTERPRPSPASGAEPRGAPPSTPAEGLPVTP